jgi:flagellar hook-associated protein 2
VCSSDLKPDVNQANATFTEDTENATLKTKIIDLDQWDSPAHIGTETLTISGKDHSGNTILPSRGLTISNDTTLAHLIEEINYYFEGVATATLENGQIVLTDHTSGTSSLEMGLTYNANGSSATLGLPTMAVSTEGGGTTATITALAPAKFVQTQQAQNAEIQIDNYTPTQVAEVQTLTPNAAATGGTFTLSFGGQTTSALAYNASVGSIQTALNALSTVSAAGGVTVAGSPLSTDPAASMTVTFATSAGNVGMVSINTGSLTGPTSVTVSETTRGSNDQWISRNSNVITDALTGMTLILQDVNDTDDAGDPIPINVTVSRNNSAVKSKVDKLVSTYNTLLTYLKEKTEYNDTTKTMGMFSSDLAVSLIKTQMKEPFVGVVSGFSSEDAYTQASDIGLSFDGNGNLKLNADTFNTALKDNYQDVIDLLGAAGTGNTNSTSIEFSNASDLYTMAGRYEVQVTVAEVEGEKVITSAQIRSSGATDWRGMTIDGNLVIGNDTFESTGYNPVYPENGLYLQVDLSTTGTFTATVNVKKGFSGRLDEVLQDITETGGRLDVSKGILDGQITQMERKISDEETRLDKVQTRLEQKYARLEKTITEWQRQLNAINTMSSVTS